MTDQSATTDKRILILDTMLDLVAEQGFHGTPMSQLAKRSGVSTGIIYHYFDNKDALIHDLYASIKVRFSAALVSGNLQDMGWPANLEQLWLNAFAFYVSHPKETRFLEQYENSPFYDHWHEKEMLESGDENMKQLMTMMQQGFAEGVIRPMPFMVLYELTFGVALGLAKRQINGGLSLDAATLASVAAACRRAIEP